jgi:arylsulfatase A-like enzyme
MRGCHSLTVATGLLAVSTSFAAVDAAERPNILFIMWDDAGLGDNSAYPNSMTKPRLLTPSAQKLADEGMLFNSGFTGAPVCAPSRSTL